MTMRITMTQARMGEAGSILAAGTTYTVGDAFGAAMVGAGYATDTDAALRPPASALSQSQVTAVQGLVSGAWKYSRGQELVDAQSPIQHFGGRIIASDYTISSGAPAVSIETRDGQECIKIVTGAGVTANVDLTLIGDVGWWGRALVQVEGNRANGVDKFAVLCTPDNFTNIAQGVYTTQTAPTQNVLEQGGRYTFRIDGQVTTGATFSQFTGSGAAWGAATPSLNGSAATVNKIRFRVVPVAGQVATAYLYGISLGPRRRKGRVFVSCDDGYKSFVQLLLPLFQDRGIPVTFSTISTLMNDRANALNYATWNDLRQIVAAGGQVVAHGPLGTGGSGNLITGLPDNANRIADMVACREAIRANGCETPNFDKVYVWPQGQFQSASNDVTLLDDAIAAGFAVGRSATAAVSEQFDFSAASRYQRMALPIIGHTYAGGSESTNITTITTAIAAAGTARSDIILMFHKGVKNADTPDAIGITVANALTIADAIVTEINAGRLQAGVLGDLAEPSVWAA